MNHALLASALILGAASPALAQPEPLVEATIDRGTRGHLIIDVEINGAGPFPFLVDTGAQGTVVFPALVEALEIPAIEGRQVMVQGAAGLTQVSFYTLDSLEIGAIDLADFDVVGGPQGASEAFATYRTYGIIGANILNDYSVEFDFADQAMRLFNPETDFAQASDGWSRTPYTLNRAGFAVLDAEINGTDIAAVLDLGASHNVINAAATDALAFTPEDLASRTATIRGFSGNGEAPPLVEGNAMTTGNWQVTDVELAVFDSPAFGALGLGETPAMFLGFPLFEGRSLVFDRAQEELVISPRA